MAEAICSSSGEVRVFVLRLELKIRSHVTDLDLALERQKPCPHPLVDREALVESRDEDLAASEDPYLLEILVLSNQDEISIVGQSADDLRVRYPALIEREVLDVGVLFSEAAVKAQRDVSVEQDPHEPCLTAGGAWSARCVA